jgi:DNA mismatch repair protein MutS2
VTSQVRAREAPRVGGSGVDEHSLRLLEFERVTATVAARATGDGARVRLAAWLPLPDAATRGREIRLLHEAIRRQREPGPWSRVGVGELAPRLDPQAREALDGPGLVEVLGWLEAARDTRDCWADETLRARFPGLAARVGDLPDTEALRARLAGALEPDGRLSDSASPELGRMRRGLEQGERSLEQRLERWARGFGESSYVTRHGERFVALVPAAGFPRRRGIVHDVSGSGHSLFVEPLELCDANNDVIELRSGVAAEERRLLLELAAAVRRAASGLTALEDALVHLDTLAARARWAVEFGAVALAPGGERLRLRSARHPLLAMGAAREAVIPLDLELAAPERVLLVSGPNMGGKTVLLKTVGLAVAMAHAALPVCAAEGSAVPELDRVVTDLGDEQSVDAGLSTFAAHLRALAEMAREAGPRCLVLCDELGAGTDPEEGAALGRALLEHVAGRGTWGVVTTHLGSLKRVAGEVPGVVNGSLEFDVETMTPRYRFLAGVPGASHALAVAARLGFPGELLERARTLAPAEAVALERLLVDLQVARGRLEDERTALARARAEAEAATAAGRAAAEDARRALEELRRRLTRESEVVLSHARELWQTVRQEARRADKTRAGAERLAGRLAAVEQEMEQLQHAADGAIGPAPTAKPVGPLVAGRRVRVRDLGVEAELVSGPDAEGRVLLRRGSWSIHSHLGQLELAREGANDEPPRPVAGVSWQAGDEAPAVEVDLRGMEAEEALRELDQGLDRAVLNGLGEVRVIHGVGRGVLRAAVERHLRGHPQVASCRMGVVGEGGRGVTVVRLR